MSRRLIFTRSSAVPIAHICGGFLWQHRHQLPQLSPRTWVAIDRIARSLVSQLSRSDV
ncbi:hypothetical protein QUA56_22405 [Microcoleus sp. N3A4]|uniref:hypothetical protein n=1 Tax=Microcoleus sp. N3A4 TaxID=3055379 RepID=UPI002FD6EEE9